VLERLVTEEIRKLTMELQHQGERCAMAGLLEQATTILAQVWAISQECDVERANAAAWEAGWLRLRMNSYDEAARWFSYVEVLPPAESRLWPAARQTLVQLCLALANRSTEAVASCEPAQAQEAAPPLDPQHAILPQLRIMSLGRLQIVRDETVLPICTAHKAIALFRYLLSRRYRAAHKEELLELLWPEAGSRSATHCLHVTVATLRRYLDPPTGSYLLFEAGHYRIHPDAPIEDDAHYFEQCCDNAERYGQANDLVGAERSYRDAIISYAGDYCVGEHDFAWAIGEQERLLARYLSVLDQLGRILIARRHFEPAIECYRRLLERDGYREDAHCQLMRCYWQQGRRHEALRQYERCASLLAKDLGLEPMPDLQKLYQAIKMGVCAPHQGRALDFEVR
jgi:DNA-binding SARP family transcriptional activator